MVEGTYRLEIVGGPYDGVRGFVWRVLDDEAFPLPRAIRVGRCSGRGECGQLACDRSPAHAAYWVPELEDPPVATITYALQEETVEEPNDEDEGGVARYALGGLDVGRRAETREMVPAGAAGGICYG